jgi:hypothetical protein
MPLAVSNVVRRNFARPGKRGTNQHPRTWNKPSLAYTPFLVLLKMMMMMMNDDNEGDCSILFSILCLDCFALKMEALSCLETPVGIYIWTSYNIPENVYVQKSIFWLLLILYTLNMSVLTSKSRIVAMFVPAVFLKTIWMRTVGIFIACLCAKFDVCR